MQSILYQPQPGFTKFVALSIMLHVVFLVFAVVIKVDTERTYYTPIYTVDIVTPPPAIKAKWKPAPAKVAVKKTVKKTAPPKIVETKPAIKETVVKVKGPPVKVAPPVKESVVEKRPDPSEAISKIREGIRKKDPVAEAEAKIEAIRAKAKRDAASVEELKKKIAEEKDVKEGLAAVRESIAAREPAKKTVEAPAAKSKSPAPVPAETAPAIVTLTKVKDEHRPYLDRVGMMINKQWSHLDVPGGNYKLLVSLKIARSGKLLDTWIEEGSPDSLFNDSLIKAVKKAAPFPPLPETMEVEVFELGLRFCPGRCR